MSYSTDLYLDQIHPQASKYWQLYRKSESILLEQQNIQSELSNFVRGIQLGQFLDEPMLFDKVKLFVKNFKMATLQYKLACGHRSALMFKLKLQGVADAFVENELMWFGYYTGFVKKGEPEIYGMRSPSDGSFDGSNYLTPCIVENKHVARIEIQQIKKEHEHEHEINQEHEPEIKKELEKEQEVPSLEPIPIQNVPGVTKRSSKRKFIQNNINQQSVKVNKQKVNHYK